MITPVGTHTICVHFSWQFAEFLMVRVAGLLGQIEAGVRSAQMMGARQDNKLRWSMPKFEIFLPNKLIRGVCCPKTCGMKASTLKRLKA